MLMIVQYVEYWNIRELQGFIGSMRNDGCVVLIDMEYDGKTGDAFRENEKGICLRVDSVDKEANA